jgi:hypothetical protein
MQQVHAVAQAACLLLGCLLAATCVGGARWKSSRRVWCRPFWRSMRDAAQQRQQQLHACGAAHRPPCIALGPGGVWRRLEACVYHFALITCGCLCGGAGGGMALGAATCAVGMLTSADPPPPSTSGALLGHTPQGAPCRLVQLLHLFSGHSSVASLMVAGVPGHASRRERGQLYVLQALEQQTGSVITIPVCLVYVGVCVPLLRLLCRHAAAPACVTQPSSTTAAAGAAGSGWPGVCVCPALPIRRCSHWQQHGLAQQWCILSRQPRPWLRNAAKPRRQCGVCCLFGAVWCCRTHLCLCIASSARRLPSCKQG